jgi:hypothetical protein
MDITKSPPNLAEKSDFIAAFNIIPAERLAKVTYQMQPQETVDLVKSLAQMALPKA